MNHPLRNAVVAVALPTPLDRLFDYKLESPEFDVIPGQRVLVEFGRRSLVGVVIEVKYSTDVPAAKLKAVREVLDESSWLDEHLMRLCYWLHRYYHQPLGEVLHTAMPKLLRTAAPLPEFKPPLSWRLTEGGDRSILRGARQQQAIDLLQAAGRNLADADFRAQGIGKAVIVRLEQLGLIESIEEIPKRLPPEPGPPLNVEQINAVQDIQSRIGTFNVTVIDGITGSGKTEAYLSVLQTLLAERKQALILVPEIGLTPQLRERFEKRLGGRIGVLHSELNDRERFATWIAARNGELDVVIGTRSALFTPMPGLGLIIVDEEHDVSLKQQDGIRYSGRDVAIQRARMLDIPIVLGSATPSLESLANVQRGRFHAVELNQRAVTGSSLPVIRTIDLRADHSDDGLSQQLIHEIQQRLAQDEQVLLFLNRRGFAPVLMCHSCGWYAECERCDSRMTLHARANQLRCHHCGLQRRVPDSCPECGAFKLEPLGQGTERLEQALQERFPQNNIIRIDRDSVRHKGAFEKRLATVKSGEPCILLGTQMLAKGHDFPAVTLVGVINLDQVLFSSDFRAAERAAQLLVQVAGRAGRGRRSGLVCIQSFQPQHPLYTELFEIGYREFSKQLLKERRAAAFPPFSYMAMLRAEANSKTRLGQFFDEITRLIQWPQEMGVYGPFPAPMERLAGRYRMQLMLISSERSMLHRCLDQWLAAVRNNKQAAKVRWSIDIDPADTY